MKKIVALFIMLLSVASMAQSPSWTTLKETNITVGANAYDIFTNGAGNHIIVQETNALKYYKMDVNGNTIIILNPPLESTAVTSPSISGDLTSIYVVYRKNNEQSIKTKYSLDGGVSWSNLSQAPPNSNASSIECVFSKGILHVTFQVGNDIYYSYYRTNLVPPSWSLPQEVSDNNTNYTVSNPRITINAVEESADTVYFTFDEFETQRLKWRRSVGGNLGELYNTNQSSSTYRINLGVAVDNEFIYTFFKFSDTQLCSWTLRRIWNNYPAGSWNTTGTTATQKFFTTTTANNIPYSATYFMLNPPNGLYSLKMTGDVNLRDELIYNDASLSPVSVVNLSSAGNDIHVIWKDNLGTNKGNNLRYKYYDDYPIPPQNLTVTKSVNNHPLLSWINPNPDGSIYKIYRRNACIGDWETNPIDQTTNLYYEDLSQSYCTAIPPAQCENLCTFEYRIKTVDQGLKESGYSNIVAARLVGGPPQKAEVTDPFIETVYEYSLGQNYPNPFNPTTTINYSIKSTGNVTLKVYDMLGKEVAVIVNEVKESGHYSATFSANKLPSGIYVYILSTGNFIDMKKLILLK